MEVIYSILWLWRTLPSEWLRYWPEEWAGVQWFRRLHRPVDSLGVSRRVLPEPEQEQQPEQEQEQEQQLTRDDLDSTQMVEFDEHEEHVSTSRTLRNHVSISDDDDCVFDPTARSSNS